MGRIVLTAQCTSAIPINFDYDPYNNQVPINLENFGYNTYTLYNKAVENELSSNGILDYYPNCTGTTSDKYNPKPQFMDIWDELPGNIMRFPGGTASQLYHSGFTNYSSFVVTPAQSAPNYYPATIACPYASYTVGNTQQNTGNNKFRGYGVRSKTGIYSESLTTDDDFSSSGESSIWRNLYNDFDPQRRRNIIYHFIELIKAKEARQGGKPVEVLYVFNIITHLFDHTQNLANENQKNLIEDVIENKIYTSPAHTQLRPEFIAEMNENLNTLRFLLDNGINVVGIEMGNELTHGRYKELNLSPNEYIEIVKQYAAIIPTDPDLNFIKIGVVGEVSLNGIPSSCNSNDNQLLVLPNLMSTKYNYCWDVALSNNSTFLNGTNTYPLYDAFIIHKYFFSSYPNIYNISDELSFAYFMSRIEDLKTIYQLNPQNQISNFKIWFTEWNQDAGIIDDTKKSENTRYIYDVYSYLTHYNALNNNLFEYTTFHNFLGASKISLIYTNGSGGLIQRDNIKAHYLMNAIQDVVGTTSTKTSIMSVPKSDALKFLDISVGNNKLWLRDYALLSDFNATQGLGKIGVPNPCPPPSSICDCWVDKYHKDIYFLFNNSTSNSYCLNPLFINPNFLAQVAPQQLLGSAASPEIYAYTEDMVSGEFNITPISTSGNNIPPKSIGYVKYNYEFYPIDCKYYGSRLAQKIEDGKTNNTLYVYPNPAQNKLFIEGFRYEKEGIVNIFDAQGKISNYKIRNNEIDISNLANGIYFLSIENEGAIFHQKLVIQK